MLVRYKLQDKHQLTAGLPAAPACLSWSLSARVHMPPATYHDGDRSPHQPQSNPVPSMLSISKQVHRLVGVHVWAESIYAQPVSVGAARVSIVRYAQLFPTCNLPGSCECNVAVLATWRPCRTTAAQASELMRPDFVIHMTKIHVLRMLACMQLTAAETCSHPHLIPTAA